MSSPGMEVLLGDMVTVETGIGRLGFASRQCGWLYRLPKVNGCSIPIYSPFHGVVAYSPIQRWVDTNCFAKSAKPGKTGENPPEWTGMTFPYLQEIRGREFEIYAGCSVPTINYNHTRGMRIESYSKILGGEEPSSCLVQRSRTVFGFWALHPAQDQLTVCRRPSEAGDMDGLLLQWLRPAVMCYTWTGTGRMVYN
ncbi:hypothetical protein BDW62DRAFT_157794 [Aspergillus aurantiobrunneus]